MPNKITKEWLYSRHPWLKIRTTLEDYVAPDYYDKLLKPYSFGGRDDLEYFDDFIRSLSDKQKTLELGTGTGRVTHRALDSGKTDGFTGVDLSEKMINSVKTRFTGFSNTNFVQSDSLKFLENDVEKYNFVFSLWSLSHSVHQHMETLGIENGYAYAHRVLHNFFENNLKKDGHFFLIHFDALSDEQKILRKILKRVSPLYFQHDQQSLSKKVVDFTLDTLKSIGIVEYKVAHLVGDPNVYSTMDEALETFINFHLESHFNDKDELPEVYQELYDYLSKFEDDKKQVVIKPGCFVYEVNKK